MAEIGVAIARCDLLHQAATLVEHLALELVHVDGRVVLDSMNIHIGERRCQQLNGIETLVEVAAALQFLDHMGRDRLVGAVVQSVATQHLGLQRPVLHNLRRQLDKVALDTAQTAILHLREECVQCVTKLVEEGLSLVDREQCGIATRRTREVANDAYDGSDAVALGVEALGAVLATPSATTLAVTRVVVEVEHTEVLVLLVKHFVGFALLVIYGQLNGAEGQTIETVAQLEDTRANIL